MKIQFFFKQLTKYPSFLIQLKILDIILSKKKTIYTWIQVVSCNNSNILLAFICGTLDIETNHFEIKVFYQTNNRDEKKVFLRPIKNLYIGRNRQQRNGTV
jgi:hypothetical protein